MLTGAWERVDQAQARELLLSGLRRTPDPLAFAAAIDMLFAAPAILAELGADLDDALLVRAASRTDAREGHMAIDALDGVLRRVLAGSARPFRLLELLTSIRADEPPGFAVAVARRLGVVYLHFREQSTRDAVRDALLALLGHDAARGDAHHELGLTRLIDALESTTAPSVEQGLRDARARFSAATDVDNERLDARLYAAALDGVLALVEQRPAADVQAAADEVHELALVRTAWRAPGRLAQWLGDTTAGEREWWAVSTTFATAARHLEDEVWLDAAASLEAIARAHRASTVAHLVPTEAPGLQAVIEPRISEAFVHFSHRRRALARWVQDVREHPELADAASGLAEVVQTPKGDAATAIAALRAKADDPEAVDALIAGLSGAEQQVLERRLKTLDGDESVLSNPVVRRLSSDLRAGLEGQPDYHDTTRIFFDRIVDLTLRFVRSRMDVQTGFARGKWSYLADPDALEQSLQLDYYDFMAGSMLGDVVDVEIPNIGGGRADVRFAAGAIRIVAEIKRDKKAIEPGGSTPISTRRACTRARTLRSDCS
jgi:hypothetical protein